ncbi:hypothetical protein KAU11_03785 [Candidatus Babeliales bacterium]|nr:hypothetical protein [Candidatus Babeliales bacterium]
MGKWVDDNYNLSQKILFLDHLLSDKKPLVYLELSETFRDNTSTINSPEAKKLWTKRHELLLAAENALESKIAELKPSRKIRHKRRNSTINENQINQRKGASRRKRSATLPSNTNQLHTLTEQLKNMKAIIKPITELVNEGSISQAAVTKAQKTWEQAFKKYEHEDAAIPTEGFFDLLNDALIHDLKRPDSLSRMDIAIPNLEKAELAHARQHISNKFIFYQILCSYPAISTLMTTGLLLTQLSSWKSLKKLPGIACKKKSGKFKLFLKHLLSRCNPLKITDNKKLHYIGASLLAGGTALLTARLLWSYNKSEMHSWDAIKKSLRMIFLPKPH